LAFKIVNFNILLIQAQMRGSK